MNRRIQKCWTMIWLLSVSVKPVKRWLLRWMRLVRKLLSSRAVKRCMVVLALILRVSQLRLWLLRLRRAGHLTTPWKNVVQWLVVLMLRIIKCWQTMALMSLMQKHILCQIRSLKWWLVMTVKSLQLRLLLSIQALCLISCLFLAWQQLSMFTTQLAFKLLKLCQNAWVS